MPTNKNNYDLIKLIFNLIVISLLIIITYRVIEPFLFGFFWAVMVVIATWPLMRKIEQRVGHKRWLAVTVMLLLLMLVLVLPFGLIAYSMAKNSTYLIDWVKHISSSKLPTLDWLNNIPLFGHEIHQKWAELIDNNASDLIKEVQPYIGTIIAWIVSQVTHITSLLFHCGVMIIFSALLFLKGERVAKYINLVAARVSPSHGEYAVNLAAQAIRAVALGVVVTALVQALIGGSALGLTGVAYPGLLTFVIFLLCVAQLGPLLVMIPAIIWQFWAHHTIAAIILCIVSIALSTLDSVMRAALIKRGADLPFLLILFGVIGGLLAFGIMGIFVGPVILALSYKLINAWVAEQD